MKKTLFLSLFVFLICCDVFCADDILGFWKTIDENTGKAQSIIAIYEYQGRYYGRIMATYNENGRIKDSIYHPVERAPGVIGNPFYSGLDIIWNLRNKENKFLDGKILDPQKGKVYGAELWRKNDQLVVRGKLWIFGRSQVWQPVADSEFKKPDLRKFVPQIPQVR